MKMLFPMIFLLAACGKEPAKAPPPAPAPAPEPMPTAPVEWEARSFGVAWSYEPEDRSLFARTLVGRPDGSVVVLGGSNRPGESGLRLTALDEHGKVLWDKTHADKRVEVSGFESGGGFALPDGAFAVVGQRMDEDLARQAWFGVFGADGALAWEAALNEPEAYALGHWAIPLADGRALVSIGRGDATKPTHELHVVSLADKSAVSKAEVDGQPSVPERVGDGYATLVWSYPVEAPPMSELHTIDAKTGALTPALPLSEGWKEAAGDSVIVTSRPLGDKQLVVVRGHGASAMVTLLLTDDAGARLWRHFIMDEGFDRVTVIQPLASGFAFVQERWITDARELRDPDGYRVVRMR